MELKEIVDMILRVKHITEMHSGALTNLDCKVQLVFNSKHQQAHWWFSKALNKLTDEEMLLKDLATNSALVEGFNPTTDIVFRGKEIGFLFHADGFALAIHLAHQGQIVAGKREEFEEHFRGKNVPFAMLHDSWYIALADVDRLTDCHAKHSPEDWFKSEWNSCPFGSPSEFLKTVQASTGKLAKVNCSIFRHMTTSANNNYWNGIGSRLASDILFRARIPPETPVSYVFTRHIYQSEPLSSRLYQAIKDEFSTIHPTTWKPSVSSTLDNPFDWPRSYHSRYLSGVLTYKKEYVLVPEEDLAKTEIWALLPESAQAAIEKARNRSDGRLSKARRVYIRAYRHGESRTDQVSYSPFMAPQTWPTCSNILVPFVEKNIGASALLTNNWLPMSRQLQTNKLQVGPASTRYNNWQTRSAQGPSQHNGTRGRPRKGVKVRKVNQRIDKKRSGRLAQSGEEMDNDGGEEMDNDDM